MIRKAIRKLSLIFYEYYAWFIFRRKAKVFGMFKVLRPENVTIGSGCSINPGVFILGHCRIEIGNRVTLSANSMLIDAGLDIDSPVRVHTNGFIRIEDDAWIGAGAIILPDVVVGQGSVVGAGSVVTRSVAPHTVVAGNPARLIRHLTAPDKHEANG